MTSCSDRYENIHLYLQVIHAVLMRASLISANLGIHHGNEHWRTESPFQEAGAALGFINKKMKTRNWSIPHEHPQEMVRKLCSLDEKREAWAVAGGCL